MTPKVPLYATVRFNDKSDNTGVVVEIDIDAYGRYYLVQRTYTAHKIQTHRYSESELK